MRDFQDWLHVWLQAMKNSLSVAKIRTLEPRKSRYKVADGGGLALEVRPSGRMSWRMRYRLHGRPAEINLGRCPQLTLTEARKRRDSLAIGIANGLSPAEQRQAEKRAEERGTTLKAFGQRYLRDVVAKDRKDIKPIQRYLERDVYPTLGHKPLALIARQDLRALIFERRDEGKTQSALALRNVLKRLFDYAVECEIAEFNPVLAIKARFVGKASSRTRALDRSEISKFQKSLDIAPINIELKAALQLILLTLTRKGELRLARWEELNLSRAEWEIPESHSKTVAQIVYLSRQAVALLNRLQADRRSGYVFAARCSSGHTPMSASTLNRALARVPRLKHFTVHDLRRTAATNLSELEYPADVIEKALNHKIKGVRGVYNRAQYAPQRRAMLQAWADWLGAL